MRPYSLISWVEVLYHRRGREDIRNSRSHFSIHSVSENRNHFIYQSINQRPNQSLLRFGPSAINSNSNTPWNLNTSVSSGKKRNVLPLKPLLPLPRHPRCRQPATPISPPHVRRTHRREARGEESPLSNPKPISKCCV
jgi:hypothetical protein